MTRPQASLQLPPQMSTFGADYDYLYNVIYWMSVVSFLLIVGFMLVYTWKYRRRPGLKAQPTGHSTLMEIVWTFSPMIPLAYLFITGFDHYMDMRIAPVDALEIRVIGSQWSWDFIHPNGTPQRNELIIPAHRPVKLIMSSQDVIHAFYVPEFRVKRDVVPGMYSTMWFEATTETGNAPVTLFCAEYCGAPRGIEAPAERNPNHMIDNQNTNHSTMLARINVVSTARYARFLEEGPPPPESCASNANPAACWGETLYQTSGCTACHSVTDASDNQPAPSWVTTWGANRTFADGSSATADENYIRQSILEPQAHVVTGYPVPSVMPAARFSDRQLDAIIAYIRSLHP